jgi:hypothetical protein
MKRFLVFPIFLLLFTSALRAEPEPDSTTSASEKGFLGIFAEMISEEKAALMGFEHHYGTLVSGVIPNTAAEKAGLQVFDYLFGIDAYRAGEGQTFSSILAKYAVGDKAKIHFIRKGKTQTADLVFGKRPEAIEEIKLDKCETVFLGVTPNRENDPKKGEGVKINPVKNSTAMDIGLQNGDLIRKINDYPMFEWKDITLVLKTLKPGDKITVQYLRGGKEAKAAGKIKSYAESKNCKKCDCSDLDEKNINIRVDIPDININIPPIPPIPPIPSPRAPAPPSRTDVSGMDAQIQEMTADEARQLSDKYGWNMRAGSQPLALEGLRISPDPGTSRFNLSFQLPQRGDTAVRVFNALGRSIFDYELGDFSGPFNDLVDISQNGPGDYYLEIRQGDRTKVYKVTLSGK